MIQSEPLLLTDLEPGELAVGAQVELEVGLEIAPAIRVKRAIYIQAIIVDPIDAGKVFMTERFVGDDAALDERADQLVAVTTEQGFPHWDAQGTIYRVQP